MSRERQRWNLNIEYHRVVLDAVPEHARSALDVGCGEGLLAFELADLGLDVVGIDLHGPSIERASAGPQTSDKTRFVQGDVFEHPFEPHSFDLVASSAMLHHVDTERGLRRMRELVRPGGTVAVISFAMPSDPLDWAMIILGNIFWRAKWVLGQWWVHDSPLSWPPPVSMKELRALVGEVLPGADVRRRMAHRYSIVWTAP